MNKKLWIINRAMVGCNSYGQAGKWHGAGNTEARAENCRTK
jgi:hypothetical protein